MNGEPVTTVEARVLRALAPGGKLTKDRIAEAAEISVARAVKAAKSLTRKGLTVGGIGRHRDTWQLSPRGLRFAETVRGRTVLDVPAIAS